jgi:hypothetical protein
MAFSGATRRAAGEAGPPGEAMGLVSVPLPAQALIGLELVTVLVEVFVEADGLVREDLIGRPPGQTQDRGRMGFADVLENLLYGRRRGDEGDDPNLSLAKC